jgi:hypothetical protein
MVVIDATTLLLMLRPGTPVPNGPNGLPIDQPKERIEHLVQRLNSAKTKIIIPTPALGEALVRAGAAASQQIVDHLQRYSVFSIEAFDTRAQLDLLEHAEMSRTAGEGLGEDQTNPQ